MNSPRGRGPRADGADIRGAAAAEGIPLVTPVSAGQKAADAFSSRAVFDEMIAQMLELFSDGTVSVSNPCVVKDADTSGTDCSAEGNTDPGSEPDGGGDGGGDGGDGGLIGGGLI